MGKDGRYSSSKPNLQTFVSSLNLAKNKMRAGPSNLDIATGWCSKEGAKHILGQVRELQQGFMMIADAMIGEAEQSVQQVRDQQQERQAWEARLLELDTVNRSHIEHLDRRFHDLNLWQQRLESLVQEANSRLSDVEQRLAQQEGLASVNANSLAELRIEKADMAVLRQECARAANTSLADAKSSLRTELLDSTRHEIRGAAALLAQDIQQLADESASLQRHVEEQRERTSQLSAELANGLRSCDRVCRDTEARLSAGMAADRSNNESLVQQLRARDSDVARMCADTGARVDLLSAQVADFASMGVDLRSASAQQSKQLSTLEQLTRMLAADSSSVSSNADRLDCLVRVMSGFLQQWHHASSKTAATLACHLNLPCPIVPPFPSQLVYTSWG